MREKLIELLNQGADNTPCDSDCWDKKCNDCIREAQADHLITNGVTIQKWIPVSERLPEHFGTFLVSIDEVHGENRVSVDSADFDPYEKSWKTFNYFCAGFKITHWMPLPEPPKEES